MAFVAEQLARYPQAHIYHYNHYEPTALKRLACRYAACEEQLDNLLRQQKFVDLYLVVRESMRTSEPGYSIKNIEAFYLPKRDNAVTSAGDSVVMYIRSLSPQDILIVSPYNMQVNLLQTLLPEARVGTVDKFQGQEAPVVIFSMATSSADDLPRNIEFLFSRNRLNVAISRAQYLAIVVASPLLAEVPCRTVDQMRLVNAFYRLYEGAEKITV